MTSESAAEPRKIGHAEYVRFLRGKLPPEAFRPHPRAYIPILVHLAIVVGGWATFRHVSSAWWPLVGLMIGNSLTAIAFLAHDVAHRTVVTSRYLLYPTELVLWSLLYVPATLWRKLHNAHHIHTNAVDDPDRRFLASELTPVGTVAAASMFPSRTFRFNPAYLLYWVIFPFRHGIVALFFPGDKKPDFVTAKPKYSAQDKRWIAAEFGFVIAVQLIIAGIAGKAWFWASIVPVCITSAVVSWYFFTNHGLSEVDDGDDILAATTTVTVPEVCNKLHSNFSYHAEHHLFPNMNPRYYPLVSSLFKEHYPDKYHCIPIWAAWSALWKNAIATPRRSAQAAKAGGTPDAAYGAAGSGKAEPAVAQ